MDTRRTPRGTAAVPQSSPEKPKGKRPAATETTAEEIVVGRRTRSKAAHSDAEPEKSVLNASGLEDSGDESPADNSNLEKTKQPRR